MGNLTLVKHETGQEMFFGLLDVIHRCMIWHQIWHFRNFLPTVELGYNDHGYNEHMAIANKMCCLVWFSIYYQRKFMVIANEILRNHGYNEQN